MAKLKTAIQTELSCYDRPYCRLATVNAALNWTYIDRISNVRLARTHTHTHTHVHILTHTYVYIYICLLTQMCNAHYHTVSTVQQTVHFLPILHLDIHPAVPSPLQTISCLQCLSRLWRRVTNDAALTVYREDWGSTSVRQPIKLHGVTVQKTAILKPRINSAY
jgi:hypothetical protein